MRKIALLIIAIGGIWGMQQAQAQSCTTGGLTGITIGGSGTLQPLTATTSGTNPGCNNGTPVGTITLTITGGTYFGTAGAATYEYSLNGGSTWAMTSAAAYNAGGTVYTISNVPAAVTPGITYDIRIRDNAASLSGYAPAPSACTFDAPDVTLTAPSPMSLSASVTNNTCNAANGAADSQIDLTVAGGTGSFTYAWSNSATSQDLNNVANGTYTVVVTETPGNCTATMSWTVSSPAAMVLNPTVTQPLCAGAQGSNTGTLAIAVTSGGTAPFTYTWNNGTSDVSNNATYNNVPLGTYTVTVQHNGTQCTATSGPHTISAPTPITFGTPTVSNYNGFGVSCATGQGTSNNGSIAITASGGTGSYNYTLGATTNTTGSFSGLTANPSYTVTAVDANNCSATSAPIAVTEPTPITGGTCKVDDPCQLGAGQITVNAAGGVAGYTVNMSGSGTGSQTIATSGGTTVFSGLPGGGTYNFTITDTNGCQIP